MEKCHFMLTPWGKILCNPGFCLEFLRGLLDRECPGADGDDTVTLISPGLDLSLQNLDGWDVVNAGTFGMRLIASIPNFWPEYPPKTWTYMLTIACQICRFFFVS